MPILGSNANGARKKTSRVANKRAELEALADALEADARRGVREWSCEIELRARRFEQLRRELETAPPPSTTATKKIPKGTHVQMTFDNNGFLVPATSATKK